MTRLAGTQISAITWNTRLVDTIAAAGLKATPGPSRTNGEGKMRLEGGCRLRPALLALAVASLLPAAAATFPVRFVWINTVSTNNVAGAPFAVQPSVRLVRDTHAVRCGRGTRRPHPRGCVQGSAESHLVILPCTWGLPS
jgi:hypothetical protein